MYSNVQVSVGKEHDNNTDTHIRWMRFVLMKVKQDLSYFRQHKFFFSPKFKLLGDPEFRNYLECLRDFE